MSIKPFDKKVKTGNRKPVFNQVKKLSIRDIEKRKLSRTRRIKMVIAYKKMLQKIRKNKNLISSLSELMESTWLYTYKPVLYKLPRSKIFSLRPEKPLSLKNVWEHRPLYSQVFHRNVRRKRLLRRITYGWRVKRRVRGWFNILMTRFGSTIIRNKTLILHRNKALDSIFRLRVFNLLYLPAFNQNSNAVQVLKKQIITDLIGKKLICKKFRTCFKDKGPDKKQLSRLLEKQKFVNSLKGTSKNTRLTVPSQRLIWTNYATTLNNFTTMRRDSKIKKHLYSVKRGMKFNKLNIPAASRYKLMSYFTTNLRKTIYPCRRGLRYCKPIFIELLNSKKLVNSYKHRLLVKKQSLSPIKLKSRKLTVGIKSSIINFTRKLKGSLLNNIHRTTISNNTAPEKKFNTRYLQWHVYTKNLKINNNVYVDSKGYSKLRITRNSTGSLQWLDKKSKLILNSYVGIKKSKKCIKRGRFKRKTRRFRVTRRLKLPSEYIPFRSKRFLSKRKYKKLKKLSNKRLVRKNYSSHSTNVNFQKNSLEAKVDSNIFKSNRQLKNKIIWAPSYKLVYRRWHSYRKESGAPAPRLWRTQQQKKKLDLENLQRFRDGLKPKRFVDKTFRNLEALVGSLTSLGYRRQRRVYSKSNGEQISSIPTALLNPFIQNITHVARIPNSFKTSRLYNNLLRTNNKHNGAMLLNNFSNKNTTKRASVNLKLISSIFDNIFNITNGSVSAYKLQSLKKLFVLDMLSCTSKSAFKKFLLSFKVNDWLKLFKLYGITINGSSQSSFLDARRRVMNGVCKNINLKELSSMYVISCAALLRSFIPTPIENIELSLVFNKYKKELKIQNTANIIAELLKNYKMLNLVATTTRQLDSNQCTYELVSGVFNSNGTLNSIVLNGNSTELKKEYYREFALTETAFSEKVEMSEFISSKKRFPARARSKITYDGLLRAFYRKTVLPKFKKRNFIKFKWVKPEFNTPLVKMLSYGDKKRFKTSFSKNKSMKYLSKRYRKLEKYSKSYKPLSFKRRLISTPIQKNWKISQSTYRKIKINSFKNSPVANDVVLQYAIAARTNSRKINEIVRLVDKRKLPAEQITPPWWKKRRLGVSLFKNTLPTPYESQTNRAWSTNRLSMCMSPTKQKRKLVVLDYAGAEKINTIKHALRSKWAKLKNTIKNNTRRYKKINLLKRKIQQNRFVVKLKSKNTKNTKLRKQLMLTRSLSYRLVNRRPQKFQPITFKKLNEFNKISTIYTLTAEQKEAIKIKRARMSQQLVLDINSYFPKLISHILKNKLHVESLSEEEIRNSVRAIYWSLRIFLSQDPYRIKLKTKIKDSDALCSLDQESFLRSTIPNFKHSDLARVRYFLQPYSLHKKTSLLRGALDWLRRYFPIKYFLFLEDSDEYYHVALNPVQVFRAHPRRGKMQDWKTDQIETTLESTYCRLTNPKFNLSSRNFENMLITNKRNPLFTSTLPNTLKNENIRTNFFVRKFSTSAGLLLASGTTKILDLVVQNKTMHTPNPSLTLPVTNIGNVKSFVSELNNTREVFGRASNIKLLSKKFININSTRKRSIRNREYLIRKAHLRINYVSNNIKKRVCISRRRTLPLFNKKTIRIERSSTALKKNLFKLRSAGDRKKIIYATKKLILPNFISLKLFQRHKKMRNKFIGLKAMMIRRIKRALHGLRILKNARITKYEKTQIKIKYAKIRSFYDKDLKKTIKALDSLKKYIKTNNTYLFKGVHTISANIKNKRKIFFRKLVRLRTRAVSFPTIRRRFEIWNYVTKLRHKKLRLLKTWLENTKYLLSKNSWKVMEYDKFKIVRTRVRAIEWRESDRHFYRSGWKKAFTFGPNGARWLQALMYRRALYTTKRGEYRRYQFPREQKRLQWLQRFKRAVMKPSVDRAYIKGRRWHGLRIANQRLQRSFLGIPNRRYAQRIMKNKQKRSVNKHWLEHLLTGWGNRLDVILLLLNVAPTPFWARELAPMGLLRVNGKIIKDPAFRVRPGDFIQWEWKKIAYFNHYFLTSYPNKNNKFRPTSKNKYWEDYRRNTLVPSVLIPLNFNYRYELQGAIFERLPKPTDLSTNSRLSPTLIKWFFFDSGVGK